jgi:hypothetical protein
MMPPPGPVEPIEYEAAAPFGPVPTAFDAPTKTEYFVPLASPLTEQVNGSESTPATVEQVAPPGCKVTVYPVIVEPPSDVGADHFTVACALPDVATTEVGAVGTVAGSTATDARLGDESPILFVATTVNVYEAPLVNPVQEALKPLTTHEPTAGDNITL